MVGRRLKIKVVRQGGDGNGEGGKYIGKGAESGGKGRGDGDKCGEVGG